MRYKIHKSGFGMGHSIFGVGVPVTPGWHAWHSSYIATLLSHDKSKSWLAIITGIELCMYFHFHCPVFTSVLQDLRPDQRSFLFPISSQLENSLGKPHSEGKILLLHSYNTVEEVQQWGSQSDLNQCVCVGIGVEQHTRIFLLYPNSH